MIISASRRTDIPAYFAEEFIAGIRAGFIDVPHPRNPRRSSRISLRPEDVAEGNQGGESGRFHKSSSFIPALRDAGVQPIQNFG